ncbi:hypothetical protein BpHYR1_048616 [Brachionus plicatilis]|uniref:Uncharacterized protein n=1 Tax=Brachionus plicatilis TaxID=10195 RepID=A0A3M7RMF6_BRAPC|nr:hypothetical protein BpHYR1_048616 [Brachionus plicatilis]
MFPCMLKLISICGLKTQRFRDGDIAHKKYKNYTSTGRNTKKGLMREKNFGEKNVWIYINGLHNELNHEKSLIKNSLIKICHLNNTLMKFTSQNHEMVLCHRDDVGALVQLNQINRARYENKFVINNLSNTGLIVLDRNDQMAIQVYMTRAH